MKTRLNLATSPLETNRTFSVVAAIVGGLGVLAMLLLSWHAFSVWRADTAARSEQAQLVADMNRLNEERADLEGFFSRPDTVQKRDRAAFLNSLIAQRAFPWTKIFMDLERSLPEGVRVVSIEPRLEGDHLQLRLMVGATNDDVKLKFLKALEGSPEFSKIEVLNETRATKPTDSDRVMLSLQAQYSST